MICSGDCDKLPIMKVGIATSIRRVGDGLNPASGAIVGVAPDVMLITWGWGLTGGRGLLLSKKENYYRPQFFLHFGHSAFGQSDSSWAFIGGTGLRRQTKLR